MNEIRISFCDYGDNNTATTVIVSKSGSGRIFTLDGRPFKNLKNEPIKLIKAIRSVAENVASSEKTIANIFNEGEKEKCSIYLRIISTFSIDFDKWDINKIPEEGEYEVVTAGQWIPIPADPVVVVGYAGGCCEFHLIKRDNKVEVEDFHLDIEKGEMVRDSSVDFTEMKEAWEYIGRKLGWIT